MLAGVLSVFLLLWVAPVKAHLTGAFADFLSIVHDESTIDKLKQEMQNTQKSIEELEPRVEQMEETYTVQQSSAVDQLKAYSETGLDAWLSLLMQEQELVDIMGNQWLVEKEIQSFLDDVNRLYLEYMTLKSAKESLEGHHTLLMMIEENIQSRSRFLAENEGLSLDQLANYLDIDWISEVEEKFIAILEDDRKKVKENIEEWATSSSVGQNLVLSEFWLNEDSELQYFFRADHVYVVYKQQDLHVILLGQVLKQNDQYAELIFEAGFFNGFLLPETLLEELPGMQLPFEPLQDEVKESNALYFEQGNGQISVKFNESEER